MFFDFGAGEIIGLAIIAIILVGPDRLPKVAKDAARWVTKIRNFAHNATAEIRENLGPGFEDLQPQDLNPKTFIKKQINSVLEEENSPKVHPKIDPDLL